MIINMKIIQTNNQIEIKTGAVGQVITGILAIGGGVVFSGAVLSGVVGKNTPAWIAVFGLVGLVVGGLILKFADTRKVTIQTGGDTTITAKRVVGGKTANQTFPTASIVAVRLSTYVDYSSNNSDNSGSSFNTSGPGQRRSNLSLLLGNNDLVELGTSGGGGGVSINGMNVSSLIQKAPLSKEANQIATFLHVPLQADDNSSVAGAVQSVVKAFRHETEADQPQTTPSLNPNAAPTPAPVQPSEPPSNPVPLAPLPQLTPSAPVPQQPVINPTPEITSPQPTPPTPPNHIQPQL